MTATAETAGTAATSESAATETGATTARKERLVANSTFLSAIGLLNRSLTVITQVVIADFFGSSLEADAYFATEVIPDLFIVLVGSGLSMAAIPIYGKLRSASEQEGGDEHWRFASSFIATITVLFLAATALLYALAPTLVSLLAPGFDGEGRDLTIALLRLMVIVLAFLGPEAGLRAVFHSHRQFGTPDLTRFAYNAVLLGAIVGFGRSDGVLAIGWGMIVGAALMMSLMMLRAAQGGLLGRPTFRLHPAVRSLLQRIPAVLMVLAWPLVILLIDRAQASGQAEGTISALGYASRVSMLPIGIVVLPIASVAYPALSELATTGDTKRLGRELTAGLRSVLFVVFPLSAILVMARVESVQLLFERGAFDHADTLRTAQLVMLYALGLPGMAVVFYLRNAYLGLDRSWSLSAILTLSLIGNGVLNALLRPMWGPGGIATATSIAAVLTGILMAVDLRRRCGIALALRGLIRPFLLMAAATALVGVSMGGSRSLARMVVGESSLIVNLAVESGAALIALIAYVAAAYRLGLDEGVWVANQLRSVRRRFGGGPSTDDQSDDAADTIDLTTGDGVRGPRPSGAVATLPLVGTVPPLALIPVALLAALTLGALLGAVAGMAAGFESLLVVAAVGGPLFVYATIHHYGRVVMAAFVIFGVVQLEPAPFDALLAALFAAGLLTGRLDPRRLTSSPRLHLAVAAVVFLVLLSTTLAGDVATSFFYTAITIYCVSIMYFTRLFIRSERDTRRIMSGYLIGAMLMVLLVLGDLIGLVPDEVVLEQGRARGFFKDSNVFGPFLVPLFILLVDEIRRPRLFVRVPLSLRLIAVQLAAVGIFFSFSRAAWGNVVLTSIVYFLASTPNLGVRQLVRFGATLLVAGIGLTAVVFAFGQGEFLTQRAQLVQSYDTERFDAQQTGIELGLDSPFIGIGPGMTDTGDLFAPHSIYVRALAETGVIGLGLLLALLAIIVVPLVRTARRPGRVYGISRAVLVAAIAGHMANGFLIDTLHWRHFWLLLGLVWLAHDSSKPRSPEAGSKQKEPALV
ncbi:MAG: O-antigen ligase family protein [Actinomycetota bacterium]